MTQSSQIVKSELQKSTDSLSYPRKRRDDGIQRPKTRLRIPLHPFRYHALRCPGCGKWRCTGCLLSPTFFDAEEVAK